MRPTGGGTHEERDHAIPDSFGPRASRARAARAFSEVADSSANGFTLKARLVIQAAPAEVYRRLIRVADWWSPSIHSPATPAT